MNDDHFDGGLEWMDGEPTSLPGVPPLEWIETICDPIWDEITITEVEKKVMSSRAMSRLRNIQQLSFSNLTYPAADYRRFQHCVGVMYAADRLLRTIDDTESLPRRIQIRSIDRQIFRLAALLHDVGHAPYSHALERFLTCNGIPDYAIKELSESEERFLDEMVKKTGQSRESLIGRHEFFSAMIVKHDKEIRDAIYKLLRRMGIAGPILTLRLDNCVNAIIHLIMNLKIDENVTGYLPVLPTYRVFRFLLSGDMDADKIDYLRRDSYVCGLPNELDISTLRRNVVVHVEDEPGKIALKETAIPFLATLLLARYRLTVAVHQETWNSYLTNVVIDQIDRMGKKGNPISVREMFTKWDDAGLRQYLTKDPNFNIERTRSKHDPLIPAERSSSRKEGVVVSLSYEESPPLVRMVTHVLSIPEHYKYATQMQMQLRKLLPERNDLILNVYSTELPKFSFGLVEHGNILDNLIIRGIMGETFKRFGVRLFGKESLKINLEESRFAELPCRPGCKHYEECSKGLSEEQMLLVSLLVEAYRAIVSDCAKDGQLLASDALIFILHEFQETTQGQADLSRWLRCNELYDLFVMLASGFQGSGGVRTDTLFLPSLGLGDLGTPTTRFRQELRRNEYIGLVESLRTPVFEPPEGSEKPEYTFALAYRLSDAGRESIVCLHEPSKELEGHCSYMEQLKRIKTLMSREPISSYIARLKG
jgi:HD superfamily phosphohydrolase